MSSGSSDDELGWGHLYSIAFSGDHKTLHYAIVAANFDFEPMCPPLTYRHDYTLGRGGTLTVNGRPIPPSPARRVLALNPYGQMEEFTVTEAEASILLAYQPGPIWEKVVLPHLARVDGKTVDGKRVGHWIVSGKSGVMGYEGDYVDGKRDGQWKYYSADGKLRATLSYKLGQLEGEATDIDADGQVTRRVRWKGDFPLDGPQTWESPLQRLTRRPDGGQSGSSHSAGDRFPRSASD